MAIKNITTPDFGSAADVTVTQILVKSGDVICVDAPIVSLESDKATMDIPSSDAGTVKEIKVKVGDAVSTGAVLLTLEVGRETVAKTASAEHSTTTQAQPIKQVEQTQSIQTATTKERVSHREGDFVTKPAESAEEVHAGPGVRRLARELGVSLNEIQGSGPKQRVLREDVEAHTQNQVTRGAVSPIMSLPTVNFSDFGATELEPLSRIKKLSGKYLQRNWMLIPHVTQFGEADITTLDAYRVERNITLKKQNIKLTILPFVIKALVASLKAFPHFNASLDAASENLVLKKYFHMGIAVDTDEGLLVPVIKNVNQKGLIDLAEELVVLSERARQKQLTPGELQGSSFSISSLGSIGGTGFTPIINYPDVAILGISQAFYKPIYEEGHFVPRLMLPLSLSYDHRVIDGATAARFMVHLTTMLSDIRNLLL